MDSAASNDQNLATVVAAWPELPEAIKAGILAMVQAAAKDRPDRCEEAQDSSGSG
jgi:hypothetical protein